MASPSPSDLAAWTAALFRAIDAKDTEAFLRFLAPDARFVMGNLPPAEGSAAIRTVLDGFFAQLASLSHTIGNAWSVPGHVVVEGRVTYTRGDGRSVSMPFCNVLALADGLIRDYRIYLDPSPLMAP